MKTLSLNFPGAILVFSTMKDPSDISKGELSRISRLALWGRENIHERGHSRAPVVVLTGNELFTPDTLEETWKRLGGRHQELVEPGWVRTDNLRVLADLTQQLYLNLPSYGAWLEDKWQRRTARRSQLI